MTPTRIQNLGRIGCHFLLKACRWRTWQNRLDCNTLKEWDRYPISRISILRRYLIRKTVSALHMLLHNCCTISIWSLIRPWTFCNAGNLWVQFRFFHHQPNPLPHPHFHLLFHNRGFYPNCMHFFWNNFFSPFLYIGPSIKTMRVKSPQLNGKCKKANVQTTTSAKKLFTDSTETGGNMIDLLMGDGPTNIVGPSQTVGRRSFLRNDAFHPKHLQPFQQPQYQQQFHHQIQQQQRQQKELERIQFSQTNGPPTMEHQWILKKSFHWRGAINQPLHLQHPRYRDAYLSITTNNTSQWKKIHT